LAAYQIHALLDLGY